MTLVKSYDQYCPVAAGLDHLGDRWTLLILRDLAWYGSARFTDLMGPNRGLPPALLSDRLHRLQDDGLVELTPSGRYDLTESGQSVRPVIDSIAAFGAQFLVDDELTQERLGYLARRLTALHASHLGDMEPTTIDFVVGDHEFSFTISADGITVSESTGSELVIETDQRGLLGLVSGIGALDSVQHRGDERSLADGLRFLRPQPA